MEKIILLTVLSLFSSCKIVQNLQLSPAARGEGESVKIKTIREKNLTIYNIDKFNTTIVKIPHISSYIFQRHPEKTIEQIATDGSYSMIVNASYFDVGTSGYEHAGYLKINDQVLAMQKNDRQIQQLFAYDSKNKLAGCFEAKDLDKTMGYDVVVQTGPQIIRKNIVDSVSIAASINGSAAKIRTAFASVDGREFYVIIARQEVTLGDLGRLLLQSGIFKGELNAINFDGGPSTVLYVKNHPEISFHADRTLPILIGVK